MRFPVCNKPYRNGADFESKGAICTAKSMPALKARFFNEPFLYASVAISISLYFLYSSASSAAPFEVQQNLSRKFTQLKFIFLLSPIQTRPGLSSTPKGAIDIQSCGDYLYFVYRSDRIAWFVSSASPTTSPVALQFWNG
jgi:hypothetical protein